MTFTTHSTTQYINIIILRYSIRLESKKTLEKIYPPCHLFLRRILHFECK